MMMTQHGTDPEFRPLGVDGILVRFSKVLTDQANAAALAFRDVVQQQGLDGVTEVASSLTSIRVGFDPTVTNRAVLQTQLQDLVHAHATDTPAAKRLWHIPVAFGPAHAPQLGEAAKRAGVTKAQAIADLTDQTVRVIAIGFAPGQPYLGMLPAHWDIPRQTTLTERLPRGALITAVRQLIIWAAEAPTGWRHIGQTAFDVYRPNADQPFAFAPGDTVRFVHVPDNEMADLLANADADGGARCEALQ